MGEMADMDDFYSQVYNPAKRPPVAGHYRQHPLELTRPRRMREFFNQDKFWVNANLEKVRIKDMDSDYLLSTMVHLIKRSGEFELVLSMEFGDSDECPFFSLQATPLFQRMRDRYMSLTRASS